MVWKIIGLLAAVVVGVYVGGSVTWEQSTNVGPFAYFQKKYPGLDGQPLLDAANRDIEEFARKQTSPEAIIKYMEEIGFSTNKYEGEYLKRNNFDSDEILFVKHQYIYGYFWKSHIWNFSFTVKNDRSISIISSFQVCMRCP